MTQTTRATGPTLETALVSAVAELVSCDPEKVRLSLDAPGIDDLVGEYLLALTLVPHKEELAAQQPRQTSIAEDQEERVVTLEDLEEEADAAADFLEGLLDALDLPGDLRIKVHEDHVELEVVDIGSGALIGRRGQTLEAIQELVRCSLQRQFQRRARVKIDAEGYRTRRLEKLIEKAQEAIDVVLDGGEPERLEPMDVFERKAIHHLVAGIEGVESRSQGREPARRVVIEAS